MSLQIIGVLDRRLRPYAQGYALAEWLHQAIETCVEGERDVGSIFDDWGIEIKELSLDDCPLDAVAAEFLLPRKSAAEYVGRFGNIENALSPLSRAYNVSKEVAALQVRNSDAFFNLSDVEKNILVRIGEN